MTSIKTLPIMSAAWAYWACQADTQIARMHETKNTQITVCAILIDLRVGALTSVFTVSLRS